MPKSYPCRKISDLAIARPKFKLVPGVNREISFEFENSPRTTPCPQITRRWRRGCQILPVPHDGAVLSHAAGAADRAQPPFLRHGVDHGTCDLGAGGKFGAAQHDLARTLKLNGYSTAQFGKCHEVPVWQNSPIGPFDAWPTGGAAGSNISTASSAARPTSGIPRSLMGPRPSRRKRPPMKAITSPRT